MARTVELNNAVVEKICADVMALPAEARIALVDKILESLNASAPPEVERLWTQEAERRVAEIDREEIALIPGEAVFARIRKIHGR